MQENFPIFILIASELLDLSGASRNEPHVSGAPGLGSPGGAQLRAESSPVPNDEFPVTEGDLEEVTFHLQTVAVDPTSDMTADFVPVRTETAARATATLSKELVRNLEGSDQLPTAALKLHNGDVFPNDLLSNASSPTSAQVSQTTTHPQQSERAVPGQAQTVPEAAVGLTSSSAGLPQPTPIGGVHQDSRGVTTVSPIPVIKQTEVPSPKNCLLTSTVNFHPPRKQTAASPFPTSVKMALESTRGGWLPTLAPLASRRPKDANPQVLPDSRAGVTPAYMKRTRSVDAQVTTSGIPQKPALVGLDTAYFRVTQTTAIQFSPILSLNQETAGSEGRNSVTAVINGSRHATLLPALQQLLQGNAHSSSLPMHPEALGHDDLIPPPFQGPINAADRPQPFSSSRTLNCTKHHASQETNRSAQESTVLVLQRDTDHLMMTSKPEKSTSSENSQASSNSSTSGQSQISVLNLSQTTRELKGATSLLLPGTSTFEKAALPPVSASAAVHAALQPLGTSVPSYVGLQMKDIPTSAVRGLHILTSSSVAGSGSQVQSILAHPGSQEAFAVMPQMSTVEDSKGQKSLPHEIDKAGSPPLTPQASVVSSPSGLRDENQKASLDSSAPSASQIQHTGSLEAFVARLHPPHAQESQSSTTARPEPAVPVVSDEIPAHLAQALLQQFDISHDAATKNLSAFRTNQPKTLPSSLYLSFLLRNTDGMICLLPMQESPLPARFLNTSVGTLVSVQQILAASNSSLLDLADLQNRSPSSLILVKPVFILFPTDRADLQMVLSPQGEDDHKSALSFTDKQVLTMVTHEHSHDISEKTSSFYPANESLRPQTTTTLSPAFDQQVEKAQVTSQPVLTNASYVAIHNSFQAAAPAADRLLDPQLRMSTAVQAAHPQGLPEELQAAAAPSPGADVPSPAGTAAEPPASPGPPELVPAQHSPHTGPTVFFKAEKPLSSSVTPLLSSVGLAGLQVLSQPPFTVAGLVDQVQHGTGLTLQTTTRGRGSVGPSSSAHARCTGCLSSAGTVQYPLKMSTSIVPLQSASQSQLSTESLQRLQSQVQFVPSTLSAFSAFLAGNDGRGSAAGSTASSGVTLQAKAAAVPPSMKPDLTKHLEFITIVPKPAVRMETPTSVTARTLFAAKVKTAASEKLLVTSTPLRMYSRSPASLPSSVSAHVPLPSTGKCDQSGQAPNALFSPANVGENGKPTEVSASARKTGAGGFLGTSTYLPAPLNRKTEQPPPAALGSEAGVAPAQSAAAEPVIALESEPKLTQTTSPSPLAVTSLSAAKNGYITTSFQKKPTFFLPTSTLQSDPNVVFPILAVMNSSAKVRAAGAKSEGVLLEGDAATTSQVPSRAATSTARRAGAEEVPLGASTEQDAGHSSHHAAGQATGLSTAKSFSVPASKFTSQSAALNEAAADGAETLLTQDLSPLPPTPEIPLRPGGAMAARTTASDSRPGATAEGLLPGTEPEEEAGPRWVTHGAPAGSEPALTPLGSEPRAPLSESRQRRVSQRDGAVLKGLAVVSDEACGSGNYTVQMSLRPAAEASPALQGPAPPQDTFLASLAVRSSSSQPMLRVRSCCVTPSSSPEGPGAVCCQLPRLLSECRHIQLLQSSEPRAVTFTIQLFQMLNHSVAYLHCELNVCLHGKPGCEQGCFESVELFPQPGDRNSPGQLRNLISLGPVLKMKDGFLYKPVEGPDSAVLVPILLGSLTGFAVLGSAFISLWLHHRQKTKNPGCPQFGEIRGL